LLKDLVIDEEVLGRVQERAPLLYWKQETIADQPWNVVGDNLARQVRLPRYLRHRQRLVGVDTREHDSQRNFGVPH